MNIASLQTGIDYFLPMAFSCAFIFISICIYIHNPKTDKFSNVFIMNR